MKHLRTLHIVPGISIGNEIRVGDPCYTSASDCKIFDAVPGEWQVRAEVSDEGSWGPRIAELFAFTNGPVTGEMQYVGELGVDSGQMAIEDASVERGGDYQNPESYYGRCCAATLSDEQWGTVQGRVVVSSSGFGDGTYPLFARIDPQGRVTAVRVVFIGEDVECEWGEAEPDDE